MKKGLQQKGHEWPTALLKEVTKRDKEILILQKKERRIRFLEGSQYRILQEFPRSDNMLRDDKWVNTDLLIKRRIYKSTPSESSTKEEKNDN